MTTNKVITSSELTGVTPLEYFKAIIEKNIWHYHSDGKIFSIFVLDFSIKDTAHSSQIMGFAEHISKILNNNLKKDQDYYTVDGSGRFIAFFVESGMNFAVVTVSKVLNEIKSALGSSLNTYIGLAECPKDGATYGDLLNSAIKSINDQKEREKRSESTSGFSLNWINEAHTQVNQNKKKTKAELMKQVNNLVLHIAKYDKFLAEHSAMVAIGSSIFARELDLPWSEVEKISVAALLHDIGYTIFPNEIFQKPESLTSEEWKLVKMHPMLACEQILRPMGMFDDYIPIIMNHHELIDGSGYPKGKKGDQIPLGAQIISIIDSYQALTADKISRKSLEFEEIVDIYIRNAGIKWDKDLVTSFSALLADKSIRKKLASKSELGFELSPFR